MGFNSAFKGLNKDKKVFAFHGSVHHNTYKNYHKVANV